MKANGANGWKPAGATAVERGCGRTRRLARAAGPAAAALLLVAACGTIPVKKYYVLNYIPSPYGQRLSQLPWPCIIRLKELDIEDAYARPQIVYRKSPFQLQYYYYKVWAVKPTLMITDLIAKHLTNANLVIRVIRRFDEGSAPSYELSGVIEAIEEYDSDEVWFAHLALRLNLVRLSDGRTVWTQRFDQRKRVFQYTPEYVVRELSAVLEYMMNQAVREMDAVLAREHADSAAPASAAPPADTVKDSLGHESW